MDRVAREKLKWKCRRGLLELDLVLGRFLRRGETDLKDAEIAQLSELLDLPDNDLWDIINGRSDRYEPRFEDLIARLRAS